jgi:signal transduction histidine kinase
LGYAEMALLKVQEVVPIKEDIQEIQQAGKRAKELVKQILAFSRHTEHERIPLNINLLIKEVLKMLRASLPTTIKIHASIKSESTTLANPTQVHQILMNLCTNAGHAMREEGGILEISLSDVDFDESVPDPDTLPGPYIKLSVSDTGQGMPPEVLRMIFDPFFTTIRNRGRDRPGSISSIWHCQKSPGDYHRC